MRMTRRKTVGLCIAMVLVFMLLLVGVPRLQRMRALDRAQQLMQEHRFAAALMVLDEFASDKEADTEVLLRKARCCRHLGLRSRFQTVLQTAEAGGADRLLTGRERVLQRVQSGDLANVGRLFSDQILNGANDLPEICEAFATGFLIMGRAPEALEVLGAWSADFPNDTQAWLLKGEAYHQQQNPEEAAKCFLRAAELESTRWELQLAAGQGLVELMDYEKATPYFEQSLAHLTREPPGDRPPEALPNIVNGLSRCLVATGQPEQAEDLYSKHPEVAETADGLLIRGRIALLDGEAESAMQLLDQALEQRRWDTEIRSVLANALNAAGRRAKAAEHFRYLQNAEPALREMELNLAAVQEDPQNADLRYAIAATMLRYSDPGEARTWALSCLAIDPDHEAAQELLAEMQEEL